MILTRRVFCVNPKPNALKNVVSTKYSCVYGCTSLYIIGNCHHCTKDKDDRRHTPIKSESSDEDTEVIVCENLEVLKSSYVGNTRDTFVDTTELPIINCKTTSDCNCTNFVIIGNCPVCTV